jgi:short-subunit dehydrogenase
MTELGFAEKYGRWALVVGASEGVGAAFARAVADQGVNVALVARREAVLDEVAAEISAATGARTRTVVVDLTEPSAADAIAAATAELEVGTVFYCAGADPYYASFLSQPIDHAVSMVQRNCVAPLQICHDFAEPMEERGRGGIVLVSSGAALVGGPNMVAYGATKAFDMVMAEALWAELHGSGVDVLGLVLGLTDTSALRRLLLQRGQLDDPDAPIPGATTAEQVVAEALANLSNGPTCFAGEDVRLGDETFRGMSRNDAARMLLEVAGGVMGPDEEGRP